MTNKRLALITGASGGIGQELAMIMARNGYNLILAGRNKSALEQLKELVKAKHSVNAYIVVADLSTDEGVGKISEVILKDQPTVLVNNAGFGSYGAITSSDIDSEKRMIDVNIKALMILTKVGAGVMKNIGYGRIMNVASLAAFQPGPLMAVYYASKAFVLSFSQAVNIEMEGTGVTVTCLCPGATETGFEKAAGLENSRLFKISKPMMASDVAEYGINAMLKGKSVAIPGFRNKAMAFMSRLIPSGIAARVAKYMQSEINS